jgi:hypothetical protein
MMILVGIIAYRDPIQPVDDWKIRKASANADAKYP